uniref:G_PROTEIN_RECEP_F1_2 domain-containing protein n=1 Tax=Syphacia muris TaxID=451379 RepID=A0A0N5AAJ2_9BILA
MPVEITFVRLVLCIIHIILSVLGTVNLLVIAVIVIKPSMRTVTNVYMAGLCIADFTYVANLSMVAIAQLKNNWPFGYFICQFYWAAETTSKYATVLFVVLMAFDRYCALCKPDWRKFRSFYLAITLSSLAWTFAALFASPIFLNVTVKTNIKNGSNELIKRNECKTDFQGRIFPRRYILVTSIVIFFLPLMLIIYFYYHILIKMQHALRTNRRLSKNASSRAPYQHATYFVLTVILSHVFAWTPFWIYTLYASLGSIQRSDAVRLLLNIMHLLPYINCAANPFIYLANFRKAFHSTLQVLFFCKKLRRNNFTKCGARCIEFGHPR